MGTLHDGLYVFSLHLNISTFRPSSSFCSINITTITIALVSTTSNFTLWHKNLIHASLLDVKKGLQSCNNSIDTNKVHQFPCGACHLGKFHKIPLSPLS